MFGSRSVNPEPATVFAFSVSEFPRRSHPLEDLQLLAFRRFRNLETHQVLARSGLVENEVDGARGFFLHPGEGIRGGEPNPVVRDELEGEGPQVREVFPIHPKAKVFPFPVQLPALFLSCFPPPVPVAGQEYLAIFPLEEERKSFRFNEKDDFFFDFCVTSPFGAFPRVEDLESRASYSRSFDQVHGQAGAIPVFLQKNDALSVFPLPNLSSSFVHG